MDFSKVKLKYVLVVITIIVFAALICGLYVYISKSNDIKVENITNQITEKLKKYSGEFMIDMPAQEWTEFDKNNQRMLLNLTDSMAQGLSLCEKIVVAAHQVADFVPKVDNPIQLEFWDQDVLPNLEQILIQDINARNLVTKSFSGIVNLSITIQKAGEILQSNKDSKKAIQVVQNYVPLALENIENCIEQIRNISNSAMLNFIQQTNKIFNIIGPESARFVEQREELEQQLHNVINERFLVYKDLAVRYAKMESLIFLINAAEKEMGYKNSRIFYLENPEDLMNEEKDIFNNIPNQIVQNLEKNKEYSWLFKSSNNWTQNFKNPFRDDQNYYEILINGKLNKIKTYNIEQIDNYLVRTIAELKYNYTLARKELEALKMVLNMRIEEIDKNINNILVKINLVNSKENEIDNMIGQHGTKLIQCLIYVRVYAKNLRSAANAYMPIISILSAIKSLVWMDIEWLKSGETDDVYLATNHLMRQVQFLNNYTLAAEKAFSVSNDYNKIIQKS